MPVSTISKDTIPMIDVPFRITGKYKGSFEESLRREYRMAFGRGMMGGEIFYPGTARIVHMRGEFTSMKFDADGASFQIEGVYVSDVAPYGLDLGVSLAAALEQKMKFFAKSVSKYAVYRGAPKGTKVIVGTPKVNVESVPIAPIGNPSRRRNLGQDAARLVGVRVGKLNARNALEALDRGLMALDEDETREDRVREYALVASIEQSSDGARFYDEPRMIGGKYTWEAFEDGVRAGIDSVLDRAPRRARPNPCSCSMRRANPSKLKARTYAVARAEILRALQQDGWDVRANLKMPHATHPRGGFRLWFKTQAIYESHGGETSTFAGAHSLWIGDIRTMPIEDVLAHIERVRKSSV